MPRHVCTVCGILTTRRGRCFTHARQVQLPPSGGRPHEARMRSRHEVPYGTNRDAKIGGRVKTKTRVAAPATPWRNRITGSGEEAPGALLANPANWRVHPKAQQDALAGALDHGGRPSEGWSR